MRENKLKKGLAKTAPTLRLTKEITGRIENGNWFIKKCRDELEKHPNVAGHIYWDVFTFLRMFVDEVDELIFDFAEREKVCLLGYSSTDEERAIQSQFQSALKDIKNIEESIFDLHMTACRLLCERAELKKIDSTCIFLGGTYTRQLIRENWQRKAFDTSLKCAFPECLGAGLFQLEPDIRVAIMNGLAAVMRMNFQRSPELDALTRRQIVPKPCEARDREFLRQSDSGMSMKDIATKWNLNNAERPVTDQVVRTAISRFKKNLPDSSENCDM